MNQTSKYLQEQFIPVYVALGAPGTSEEETHTAMWDAHRLAYKLIEADYKSLPGYYVESTHHDNQGTLLPTFDTCQQEFEIQKISGTQAFCQLMHSETPIPLDVIKQFKELVISAYTRALVETGKDGVPVNIVQIDVEEKYSVTEVVTLEGI